MILTQSEENYIKAIYSLCTDNDSVSTNDLADRMQTKASSVTDMIRKLSEKKFVKHQKYKGCKLTSDGNREALKIIRKHRLWEVFLVEKLEFGWDEVHDIAEQLEHIRSVKLTNKLDEFLEFPKYDPHGDPIPDSEGNLSERKRSVILTELEKNQTGRVTGVGDSAPSFLQFLDKHNIGLGSQLSIIDRFEFDGSITISINNKELNLSKTASQNIIVEPIN